MCGIAGWVDWELDLSVKRQVVEAMAERLHHRGPDDSGVWLSPHAALAHRRLIVVDPVGGGQPMVRRRGEKSYVIVYNGELYNTVELRDELKTRGYTFRGRSDTEVLLTSYMEWGPACVGRLNGIFAFGIWSETDQSLFLARDRLGVKPLFYAIRGSGLVFASELKALLVHPAVPPEIDGEGLAEILVMGPARTPGHGVFRGVSELKPGYWLIYDRNGAHIHRYWALESRPHADDLEATAARVRELLGDAVERQLVADVPVSVLLSGGLDSTAITAFAAAAYRRAGAGPLDTYSVDYAGNDKNFRPNKFQPDSDAPWVKLVSERFGTRHHPVIVDTPQLVEALKTATRARDLPGMADVDASLYLFSREIKQGATVALSGESSDEIFGGYPWFQDQVALPANGFPWIRMIKERAGLLSPEVLSKVRPEEYAAERYHEALREVPRLPGEQPYEARMREMLYLNITRFMPVLLDRKDRMSMAVGLEVRVPYCDHRLVEYVWNIPWGMKRTGGMEKGILRLAMRGLVPEEVLARRKSPYPKTHNPVYFEAIRNWMARILEDATSPLLPLINIKAMREVVQSGAVTFNPAWFSQLMGGPQLLAYFAQVDAWLREYRVILR